MINTDQATTGEDVEGELIEDIESVVGELPEQQRLELQRAFYRRIVRSGPVPSATEMAAYARIFPDAPKVFFQHLDRRMALEEKRIALVEARTDADILDEADHRNKNQTYRMVGLYLGAAVTISLIASGTLVAIIGGAPFAGGLMSITGVVVGLAGVFVRGRPLIDGRPSQAM
ncbi:hypothetical protein NDN16_04570 [Aureimonas altamirensis]|uniref:hypothetical protein n=1 Tax=Aureimonas altamirensis TaxID=370622 RepID=UPI0020368498|nr:hypothetical protein [Aureimonas altamirensis]MCM2502950.1 hypothetical protein [Aureimonas altamirensis]